jgi:excinuclease ABC subunit B
MDFSLRTPFQSTGDQPKRLFVEGVRKSYKNQVLLGATGTGKTFSMAQIITQLQRPALVMLLMAFTLHLMSWLGILLFVEDREK